VAIRVAVDALGGDRAPLEVVSGALAAATPEIEPILYGPADLDTAGLGHVVTDGVVAMDDKPAEAVRGKPDASLVRAVSAAGSGAADAVVSAGNTGAMLAAGLLHIRRLQGAYRPCIAVVIPTRRGPSVLIDAGANADARPEHLVQFAHMGSVFAQEILDVAQPRVRLLSIGEEPEKGNQLMLDARSLLAASDGLRFEGNTEGHTLLDGEADVIVCDGFTGNVALKTLEGSIRSIIGGLRDELDGGLRGRLGGLLIRPAVRNLRARLDPDAHGGAYLLGLRSTVVIAHGSSSRRAIANAIRMAARGVEHDIVGRLQRSLPERVVESARSTTPNGNK
jgi:phosphate acyltransferase